MQVTQSCLAAARILIALTEIQSTCFMDQQHHIGLFMTPGEPPMLWFWNDKTGGFVVHGMRGTKCCTLQAPGYLSHTLSNGTTNERFFILIFDFSHSEAFTKLSSTANEPFGEVSSIRQ